MKDNERFADIVLYLYSDWCKKKDWQGMMIIKYSEYLHCISANGPVLTDEGNEAVLYIKDAVDLSFLCCLQ